MDFNLELVIAQPYFSVKTPQPVKTLLSHAATLTLLPLHEAPLSPGLLAGFKSLLE